MIPEKMLFLTALNGACLCRVASSVLAIFEKKNRADCQEKCNSLIFPTLIALPPTSNTILVPPSFIFTNPSLPKSIIVLFAKNVNKKSRNGIF